MENTIIEIENTQDIFSKLLYEALNNSGNDERENV